MVSQGIRGTSLLSGGRNGHLRDGHMRALPDLLHLLIDSCSEDSGKTGPYLEMVNASRDETGTD